MIKIIIILISLILDGVLTNYLGYYRSDLSIFNPLFTLVCLMLLYKKYDLKEYLIVLVITSIVYDLMYTNILFLNTFLFLVVYFAIKFMYKKLSNSYFNNLLICISGIIIYLVAFYFVLLIINYSDLSIYLLGRQIVSSILMNLIYFSILYYFVIKKEF